MDEFILKYKKSLTAIILFICFLPTIFLKLFNLFSFRSILGPFVINHFIFNYEIEFVKRGFIGEILRLTFNEVTNKLILISFILLFIFIFLLIKFYYEPYDSKNKFGLYLFFIFAITHFATINNYIYDIGRFDQFLIIILLTCIYFIKKYGNINYLIIPLLCLIALLIHEAFFFMFLPLIFVYWIYIKPKILKKWFFFLIIIFLLFSTFLIGHYGKMESIDYETYKEILIEKYGEDYHSSGAFQVLYGNIKDNMIYTWKRHLTLRRLIEHIILFICLIPTFYLMTKLFKKLKKIEWLLILSAFGPLALYILGHDYARWWGLAITNLFIVIVLLSRKEEFKENLNLIFYKYRKIVYIIIILSIIVGPIGTITLFPRITYITYYFPKAIELIMAYF